MDSKVFKILSFSTLVEQVSESINRGLQALSVQFRFAFSKPSSSQTHFLNRPVAAPAEVAHFCRYKNFYFLTNLRLEGWIL